MRISHNELLTGPLRVVIPVRNGEDSLIRCVNSIRSQTIQDYRAIIVDDASVDNTETVCKMICKDKRFIYFRNDIRQGPLASRITGATLIHDFKNSMIITIDGDDELSHTEVFKQILVVRSYGNLVIYGKQQVYLNGTPSEIKGGEYPSDTKLSCSYRTAPWLCGQPRCAPFILWSHVPIEYLKPNNVWFTAATDMALFISLMELAWNRVACLPNVAYNYHRKIRLHEYSEDHIFFQDQRQAEAIIRSLPKLNSVVSQHDESLI